MLTWRTRPSLGQGKAGSSRGPGFTLHTVGLSHLEPHSAPPHRAALKAATLLGHHASRETGEAGGEGTMGNRIRRKQGSSWPHGQTACGSPSTMSAHREKLEAHELSSSISFCYKLGSVVCVFEGCSMLIELRNRHGISKGVARLLGTFRNVS